MNTFWSENIQTSIELYDSRALRFREDNRDIWLPAMGVYDGMDVLEVGCAGGLLLNRLKNALPNIRATGLDNDINHISFAKEKIQELNIECNYICGNAMNMPFQKDSFDYIFSHTVIEHVPTQPFLQEQKRVLRTGGRINVMSVRTSLNIASEGWKPENGEEKLLFDKLWAGVDMEEDKCMGVAQYPLSESQMCMALDQTGFDAVEVRFIVLICYAPDSYSTPLALAEAQINGNRLSSLESVSKAARRNPKGLTECELSRLVGLINTRYDDRIERYRTGQKMWDISTSTIMIATGIKPTV